MVRRFYGIWTCLTLPQRLRRALRSVSSTNQLSDIRPDTCTQNVLQNLFCILHLAPILYHITLPYYHTTTPPLHHSTTLLPHKRTHVDTQYIYTYHGLSRTLGAHGQPEADHQGKNPSYTHLPWTPQYIRPVARRW